MTIDRADDDDEAVGPMHADENPSDGLFRATDDNDDYLPQQPSSNRLARVLSLFLAFTIALIGFLMYFIITTNENSPAKSTATTSNLQRNKYNERLPAVNWRPLPRSTDTITKIAFGSCSSQNMPQPYWDTLMDYQPDLFIFGGDNIYGDCLDNDDVECDRLFEAYNEWAKHASFSGATERLSIIATLDDHDYALNDCDGSNPHKQMAKQAFLDFFHDVVSPEVHERVDDGVYQEYVWGPEGRRVQVILLDTRYNRSPFFKSGEEHPLYLPWNATNILTTKVDLPLTMLGERQSRWLEDQFAKTDIDLRILVSSIQVLNDVTDLECWRMIPSERDWLYDLMRQYKSVPSIILSGDRHVGGIYHTVEKDIVEVTSSALTHTYPCEEEDSDTCPEDEDDPRRYAQFVHDNNFASIEIDWDKRTYVAALRRTDSTPGVTYSKAYSSGKHSDAGHVLQFTNLTLAKR